MKIYLFNQFKKFPKHLQSMYTLDVMQYNLSELKEVFSEIKLPIQSSLGQVDSDFLFNYDLFPKHILEAYPQWIAEGRTMQVGDTIAQQVFLPPLKNFSQKIIFGVRISEVIKDEYRLGFTYETLKGHVEKGKSTFLLEQKVDGLYFSIQTFSVPGNFLTKLLSPIFSIPYQSFCTKSALKNVASKFK
jgi:hypothetical protein